MHKLNAGHISYNPAVLYKLLSPAVLQCAAIHCLTPREAEIIALIVSGKYHNRSTGSDRSHKTQYAQRVSAYRRIGIKSDVELLHYLYWLSGNMNQDSLISDFSQDLVTLLN